MKTIILHLDTNVNEHDPILHLDTNINEHERVSNITLDTNESKETACSKKRYKCN